MQLRNKRGQPLTVWYLSPHDKIPGDSWGYDRALTQIETLASAGCQVIFWAGTFSHSTKVLRGAPWEELRISDKVKVILVPVRSYARHGSVARFGSLFDFGYNIWRHKYDGPAPDLILTVMPTPFVDLASVWLARRYGAKFVQDFRDLWPELFVHVFPPKLRPLAKLLIKPLQWIRKWVLKRSDGFISVTNDYLSFAKSISNTVADRPNAVVYFGVDTHKPDLARVSAEKQALLSKKDQAEIWFVYGGTLGENYDIRTVVDTFSMIVRDYPHLNVRLKIAGNGPLRDIVIDAARSYPEHISYFGPLNKDELWVLLESSDVGLLPYADFSTVSVPAKTFDYIAAGLPMINSLPGEIESIITERRIGLKYHSGSKEDLQRAIIELVKNPHQISEMKARSAEAAALYSRTNQYRKLIDVVASVCPQSDSRMRVRNNDALR